MKILLSIFAAVIIFCNASAQSCKLAVEINLQYSKADSLQRIMNRYTQKDLPGISVAVYSETEGWWAGAAGFAKTETNTPMTTCNLQYIQSVAKTYMAVAILKLHEAGKIDLNAPITKYLPKKISSYVKNAGMISVRMLLNHTSGIAEYVSDPEYIATVLLTPTKVAKMEEVLAYIQKDEPQFAPGTKYTYTNTNFTLLAMIADAITGDHAKYISTAIFTPLGLTNTYNRNDKGFLNYPDLVNCYWDLLNAGRPANITPMQKANVQPLIGDDGIVCTPVDVVKFFKGLMEGKLLQDSSLKMMQEWQTNKDGYQIYGLGLARMQLEKLEGVGHGGGGIGAGCIVIYVPEKKTCVFVTTNIGVIWDGIPAVKAGEMKDEIFKAVLL
jgi:D-alanyl-D-alanine carboxypeptidase